MSSSSSLLHALCRLAKRSYRLDSRGERGRSSEILAIRQDISGYKKTEAHQ